MLTVEAEEGLLAGAVLPAVQEDDGGEEQHHDGHHAAQQRHEPGLRQQFPAALPVTRLGPVPA